MTGKAWAMGVLLVTASATWGCVKDVHFYPGPERPNSDLAVVAGTWDAAHGRVCVKPHPLDPALQPWAEDQRGCFLLVHLLPGRYRFEILLGKTVLGATGGTQTVTRLVEAAHGYRVRFAGGTATIRDETPGVPSAIASAEEKWLTAPHSTPAYGAFLLHQDERALHGKLVSALKAKTTKLALPNSMRITHVEDSEARIAAAAERTRAADETAAELQAVDSLVKHHEQDQELIASLFDTLVFRSVFKRNAAANLDSAKIHPRVSADLYASGATDDALILVLVGSVGRVLGPAAAKKLTASQDRIVAQYGGPPGPVPKVTPTAVASSPATPAATTPAVPGGPTPPAPIPPEAPTAGSAPTAGAPTAETPSAEPAGVESRLGEAGETCRSGADCRAGLECSERACHHPLQGKPCQSRQDCGEDLRCQNNVCVSKYWRLLQPGR